MYVVATKWIAAVVFVTGSVAETTHVFSSPEKASAGGESVAPVAAQLFQAPQPQQAPPLPPAGYVLEIGGQTYPMSPNLRYGWTVTVNGLEFRFIRVGTEVHINVIDSTGSRVGGHPVQGVPEILNPVSFTQNMGVFGQGEPFTIHN